MQDRPDSLARTRGIIGTVNYQMPFSYANKLGFNPKTSYWLIQNYGLDRVLEVFTFYVSIHKVSPSFFWSAKDGTIIQDPDERAKDEAKRFCAYIYNTITKHKPLHVKYAGPYYFQQGYGKQAAGGDQ